MSARDRHSTVYNCTLFDWCNWTFRAQHTFTAPMLLASEKKPKRISDGIPVRDVRRYEYWECFPGHYRTATPRPSFPYHFTKLDLSIFFRHLFSRFSPFSLWLLQHTLPSNGFYQKPNLFMQSRYSAVQLAIINTRTAGWLRVLWLAVYTC